MQVGQHRRGRLLRVSAEAGGGADPLAGGLSPAARERQLIGRQYGVRRLAARRHQHLSGARLTRVPSLV